MGNGILTKVNSGWTKIDLDQNQKQHHPKVRFYQVVKKKERQAYNSLKRLGQEPNRLIDFDGQMASLEHSIKSGKTYLMRKDKNCSLITANDFSYELYQITQSRNSNTKNGETYGAQIVKKLTESFRMASVDKQKPNAQLTDEQFKDHTKRGSGLALSGDNPFRPKLVNGQIKWSAKGPVSAKHVEEIISKTTQLGRSLHINTGTHGDPVGNTVVQKQEYAEVNFSKEDLDTAWDLDNVSIHIMSSGADKLDHDQFPNIDIIDAWCFSEISASDIASAEKADSKSPISFIWEKLAKINQGIHQDTRNQSDSNPSLISRSSGQNSTFFGGTNSTNNNYGIQQGNGSRVDNAQGGMHFGRDRSSTVDNITQPPTKRSRKIAPPNSIASIREIQELIFAIENKHRTKESALRHFGELGTDEKKRYRNIANELRKSPYYNENQFLKDWKKSKWKAIVNNVASEVESMEDQRSMNNQATR